MKKLGKMVLCMTMCMTMLVTGCGKVEKAVPVDGKQTEDKQETVEKKKSDKKIALLIPSPVGDPFIALCVKGLERVAEDADAELKIIETLDKAEYEDQVRAMAELGANPIYTMWGDLSEIALRIAPEYPETDFILCDVYMETNEANVSSVSVDPTESSFIAGYIAANNTQANKVGFIAHADRPVSRKYRDGFINGAHYVNPDINVEVAYVGNDQDPVKGQEVAKLMIQNNGVDLIFQSASRSGLGVITGCKELGIKCIGSDDWQGEIDENVIWSALKPIDEALYLEGMSSFEDKFVGGDKAYGLQQGLPMYDQRDFEKLEKSLQDQVIQLSEDIKSGKVDVTKDTTK